MGVVFRIGGRKLEDRGMTVRSRNVEIDKLADELFSDIQRAQGYAYVSDGETFKTKSKFFERVRGRLEWQKEGVEIMVAFLERHGELK